MLEFFGSISSGLVMVLKSNIKVCQYYHVEKDPQAEQASMCYLMMM
jgi:hypothetical protein